MGISSTSTAPGDPVRTLLGGGVPFVCSGTAAKSVFSLVGEGYVHDIVDGELWKRTEDGKQLKSLGGGLVIEDIDLA